ncbi:MAG: D-alanyl-D-alanine carboxypeptidase [Clostridia bacterium]|nr:D-alanyl-D-alanine carboxypeptidase [Clostridia bacterium]
MRKKLLYTITTIFILLSSGINALAAYVDGEYISSQGACVMDYETGTVLYEYNGKTGFSPASMTKVMSLYCIYGELDRQNIALDTVVPISDNVFSIPARTNYQCIPLYRNVNYTVDELMGAVATYSASNALIALAEFVSGTESKFVSLMNDTAKVLGIEAHYYDSCGGAPNSITPVSMATLARRIIMDYPDIIKRTSQKSIIFNGLRYNSTNKLYTSHSYSGADGLKTGTSSTAGFCFCGTAVRDGRRIITVTMNSSGNDNRFSDTIKLLDYGFRCVNEGSFYHTDISTYIDGYEIPTFVFYNKLGFKASIIAEDLCLYGFDTSYDYVSSTLTAVYNSKKPVTPIDISYYKNKNMQEAYSVYPRKNTKVVIIVDGVNYNMDEVYNLNGYLAIPMDDFADIFTSSCDGNTKSAYIFTK